MAEKLGERYWKVSVKRGSILEPLISFKATFRALVSVLQFVWYYHA